MRLATAAACATLLAAGLSPAGAAIVRCEAADGKVTYSNTECPPNTKMVRKVEPSPPVVVHDGGLPQAGAAVERPVVKPETSRPRRVEDPVQIDEELSAQLAAQRRECEARARELQRLRDDIDAAAPSGRASAELSLRRAQDDYRALCPRQR
jgi:hypothetical protein